MKSTSLLLASTIFLASCGGSSVPTASTPNLEKPYISMRFIFAEGSTCYVDTSFGRITQDQIPGSIRFPVASKMGNSRCTETDGTVYKITTHNSVPNNTFVGGVTVSPKTARITASTDPDLLQFEVPGSVVKIR